MTITSSLDLLDLQRLGLDELVRQAMSSAGLRGNYALFLATRRGTKHRIMKHEHRDGDVMVLSCYDEPPIRVAFSSVAALEMHGRDRDGAPVQLLVA